VVTMDDQVGGFEPRPLDPLDVKCSAAERFTFPPSSAPLPPPPDDDSYRRWNAGYEATKLGRHTRRWAEGWDVVNDRCPPDPVADASPGRQGWRDVDGCDCDRWREVHERRRRVVRALRRAGYVQRHHWPRLLVGQQQVGRHVVDDWRYLQGVQDVEGLPAVDAWQVARHLGGCSASWYVQLRADTSAGLLTSLAVPRPCGHWHVCPVCAARRSAALARALRGVISADLHGRALALVTLTQRDRPGEPLFEALERWRRAWRLMTRGRPGRSWKRLVSGYYYGLEVTRGERWWHVHAHAVLVLQGAQQEEARAWVGSTWRAASDAAGPGYGWSPHAGGCVLGPTPGPAVVALDTVPRMALPGLRALARALPVPVDGSARMARADLIASILEAARAWNLRGRLLPGAQPVTSWAGPWWQVVDPDDPRQVYQACKYPSPCGELAPRWLAEFLAVAHGRRWHQGGGALRSVVARAADLVETGALTLDALQGPQEGQDGQVVDVPPPPPMGVNVGSVAPGECPPLDAVADGLGWPSRFLHGRVDSVEDPTVSWRLLCPASGPQEDLRALVLARGGTVGREASTGTWWAQIPRAAVRSDLVARDTATRERRSALRATSAGAEQVGAAGRR
jgi:hypothetical protein